MLLILDNYDSFTYNLAQYFGELGADLLVKRNDEISIEQIETLAPEHICISPGPCTPRQAGISNETILRFGQRTPILGVCLGHQCIGEVYGGTVVRAPQLVHGKSCTVSHNGDPLFAGVPQSFTAGRYHSLVVSRDAIPPSLETTATTSDGEVMALRHRQFPVHGVQFHPESILTPDGKKILANFLALRKS